MADYTYLSPPNTRLNARDRAALDAIYGAQPAPVMASAPAAAQASRSGLDNFLWALAQQESGQRYDLLGPPTRRGDRAFGKYQVMGENIGPWTEKALGQRLTPQEFLASPQAQEAVARTVAGGYYDKYGPAGAASMWHSGRPDIPNVSDGYIRTPDYVRQVLALSQKAPPEGAAGAVTSSSPQFAGGAESPALGTPAAPTAPTAAPAVANAPAPAATGLGGLLARLVGAQPTLAPVAGLLGIPGQPPQGASAASPAGALSAYQPSTPPPLEMPAFDQLQFANQQPLRLARPQVKFGRGFY